MNNPAQPYRILVVDDVPTNLKLVMDILTGSGYQVSPAASGTMALRSVAVEAPDLILLDVIMPEMDGYEVCRRLKADEQSRSIPVIFLSALDETADKVKGFEAGGVDYITKPFQPMEMLKRIETHLALRRLQQQMEGQNRQLRQEIAERERVERLLKEHEAALQKLVAARTAELEQEIRGHEQTEHTLRDSQQRMADIIRLLPDPTFAIDLEGRVIIWNRAAEEFTGIKSADMLSQDHYEYALPFYGTRRPILLDYVLHPSAAILAYYTQIRHEKGLVTAEAYTRSFKGGDAYLLITASSLFDAKGKVIGAIESVRDITERKLAEEALKEYAHFLQILMDAIPNPIFYKDTHGVYQGCNAAFETYMGCDKSRIVGSSVHDLAPKELADQYHEMDMTLLAQGGVQIYESSIKFADGTPHDVLFNKATYINAHGSLGGLVGVMLDITERKRAELAIREANDRFKSVLRAATAYSIIGTDPEGIIKVFNEGAELMLGYRADEVIDKATPDRIHDSGEIAARAAEMGIDPGFEVLVAAARRGETESREWTYIHKEGSRLTVSLTVTAMRSETGLLTGFIGIARDITAEKKLEQ